LHERTVIPAPEHAAMQRDHQLTAIDLCFGGQLPPHSANLQIILTMATTSAAAASAAAAVSAVELNST